MKMSKAQAIAHIQALYHCFNMADSDNPERADWTKPSMAADCCKPLDAILRQLLSADELEALYANGEIG
jgi:hypothetical protein